MYLNDHLRTLVVHLAALLGLGGVITWALFAYGARLERRKQAADIAADQAEADIVWKQMEDRLREQCQAAVAEEDDRYTTAHYPHYRDRLAMAQLNERHAFKQITDPAVLEFPSELEIHGAKS